MAGEIKNYLKSVKDITAPLNWKSAPDSPPTQLAYVTQPEIDMLVKANIHGSMNGKPNKGPKGIISLDGLGEEDKAYDDAVDKSGNEAAIDNYFSSGQYQSDQNQGNNNNTAQDIIQNVANYQDKTGDMTGGNIITSTQNQATAAGIALSPPTEEEPEEERLAALAKIEADRKAENKKRGILSIIGHGEVLDDYIGDTAWLAQYDTGQHKLRRQLDRLVAKYGEDFLKTVQAKSLMNYLSGVAVERGGSRGARDDTYGGDKFATETGMADPELEKQRQALLAQISGMGTPFGGQDISSILAGITRDGIGADMTPEQYFNFRQQLMSADPTPGNQAYKDAFPWSSGAGLKALSRFIPGIGAAQTFLGGLFPEQSEWADWAMNERPFYDTSMPVYGQDNQMDRREPSWWNANAESQPVEDPEEDEATTDVVDLTPTPTPYPVYGTGIAGLDWASLAPQFRPQYPGHYSNQGIQPNFANWYDNLNQYYG